jgi:hypothetical protein
MIMSNKVCKSSNYQIYKIICITDVPSVTLLLRIFFIACSNLFFQISFKFIFYCLMVLQIRDKFYDIQNQLQKASKWREAICGEPYDLTFLNEMTVKLDVRQELWKYVESSTHAIRDWKSMLFKKV